MCFFYFEITQRHINEIKDKFFVVLGELRNIYQPAEYLVHLLFTSESHIDMRGVYNGILTPFFFVLFFFRTISIFFKKG